MRPASLRALNPLRLISSRPATYSQLPETANGSADYYPSKKSRFPFATGATQRFRTGKMSSRLFIVAIAAIFLIIYLSTNRISEEPDQMAEDVSTAEEHANTRYWEVFPR